MRDRRMDVKIRAEKQDREEESRAKTEGKVSREGKIRDKWGGGGQQDETDNVVNRVRWREEKELERRVSAYVSHIISTSYQ